jgi:hypothetical protein
MSVLKPIINLIVNFLEANSVAENNYQIVEESRAELSAEEILEIVTPVIREENLSLEEQFSAISPAPPVLQEDIKTKHLIWLVSCLYNTRNGESVSEQTEYCWLLVDDKTGKITEKIFPR